MNQDPAVFLVDDDDGVRKSLEIILSSAGLSVVAFASPADLLDVYDIDHPGCLVLDLRMPQMTGLELWRELRRRGGYHPCIIITAHGTIAEAVEAIRSGAVDFLEKSFQHEKLIARVRTALAEDVELRAVCRGCDEMEQSLSQLTPRERQVLDLVLEGKLSKQIARELNITTKTVEVHRSNVTRKMGVTSVAQLFKRMNDHSTDLARLASDRSRERSQSGDN